MIHTPVHASWLNQIEIFFSIVQKKVVSANLPRHLRAVSSVIQSAPVIAAFGWPRAASKMIWARSRSRCAVLWPCARFFQRRALAGPQGDTGQQLALASAAPGKNYTL